MIVARRSEVVGRIVPVVLAIGLSLLLFALTGFDVGAIVDGIVEGSLTGDGALANTVRWTIPLVVIGLGVGLSLRAGEFNIGGQGQFLVGSLMAVWVGLRWDLPTVAAVVVGMVVATVAGALWSGVAGVLKVAIGADEVIVTLMLNFIAIQLVSWVTTGPLRDPLTSGDAASTARLDESLRLQSSGQFSVVLIFLTLVLAIATWLLVDRTKFGWSLSATGANPRSAEWWGLPVRRLRLATYLLAGAFAGLAGAFEVFGPSGRVATGATPTVGFTALVVATVGSLTVFGTIWAGLVFGALQSAVLFLPIVTDLPPSGLRIIEGLVALLITAQFALVLRRRTTRGDDLTAVDRERPDVSVGDGAPGSELGD